MQREQGSNWPRVVSKCALSGEWGRPGNLLAGPRTRSQALAVSDSEHKEISQRGMAGLSPSNLLYAVSHLLWSSFYFFFFSVTALTSLVKWQIKWEETGPFPPCLLTKDVMLPAFTVDCFYLSCHQKD